MENTIHWLTRVAEDTAVPVVQPLCGAPQILLQTPLHDAVVAIKNEIDRKAPEGSWDDAKKITNTYEYIFLSLQRRMSRSVAAIHPLSRSYFKMIEIWDQLGLSGPMRTAHTAEGPGGFLEAIQARTDHRTTMIAMTLRSTERTVPGWRKSAQFLHNHPQILITYGADNTGNLYHLANQEAFARSTRSHLGGPATLYTADGGFDFSADFNGQENTVQRLLVAEAYAGLQVLEEGGTMILKMFDTKQRATLEFLWCLSLCFARTAVIKPFTSRPANSERYWIGVGYRGTPAWLLDLFRSLVATEAPNGWSQLFATVPAWPTSWLGELQTFQESIEEQQFHKIQLTLNLIKATTREQIRGLLLENIRNSRRWCETHGVPMNRQYENLSDDEIVNLNLEEALAPFPVAAGQKNSPAWCPPPRRHHVSTAVPSLPTPVGQAWRQALPASVLGRTSSQTASDTPPSDPTAPSPAREV